MTYEILQPFLMGLGVTDNFEVNACKTNVQKEKDETNIGNKVGVSQLDKANHSIQPCLFIAQTCPRAATNDAGNRIVKKAM